MSFSKLGFRLLRQFALGMALAIPFAAAPARAELQVVATIKPLHALVAEVMGTTGTPELLVGGSASPHTFVMKPSDMRKLAAADIVFRIGEPVEPFTIKAATALPASVELVTLLGAPGMTILPQRLGGPFEAHEHHDHHDQHDPHDDDDEDHGGSDGHVWLDPANARAMLDAIASRLSARSPDLAATYAANAAAAKARIATLDADLARELAPFAGRPYVVFHDAYQYFEKRYGLAVVGSITVNPEVPPSGHRLSALREKIKRLDAKCVFGEPNFEAKVIAAVIEGTGARRGVLDPEGASLPPGPGLYAALMRGLADGIRACLQ